MLDELRDYEIELIVVEELVHPHDVWVRGPLKDLQLVFHQLDKDFSLVYQFFLYDFDRALDVGTSVSANSNLSKATLTQNMTNTVPFFDICHFFKTAEILEALDVLMLVSRQ